MAKGKKRGASKDVYIKSYNYVSQKVKRLERAVNRNPNDLQAIEALKKFKKAGNMEMQRSKSKGGWVNRSQKPWVELSGAPQPSPLTNVSHSVSQAELIMSSGLATKKMIAQFEKSVRNKNHIFEQIMADHKKFKKAYSN